MSLKSRIPIFLTVVLLSFALVQCGKEEAEEKKVKIYLKPENPIVIDADYTVNQGEDSEFTIPGPWFSFNYTIDNGTDDIITIASWSFEITTRKNGQKVTSTTSIDPGFVGSDLPYLDQVPANTTGYETGGLYFVGGLQESDNFIYEVEMKLEGWFGAIDDPTRRINKTFTFFTQ